MQYRLLGALFLIVSPLYHVSGMERDAKKARKITLEQVFNAIEAGNRTIVEDYIEGEGYVDSTDTSGVGLIHKAAEKGDVDILNYLIKHRAYIHVRDRGDGNAMHWAAMNGHVAMLKLLSGWSSGTHLSSTQKRCTLSQCIRSLYG